ncbi:MAG: hypothetical protein NTU43_07085 [Bacteroidetes bacterium]|nr:hypothetical protein [Bacteroidota bacterium]
MKTLALLLIFIFGFLLTQAQQKIVFLNKNKNSSKAYSLPLSVTCTFNDGSEKRLILENVIGDSLVFKKFYNQSNFDCKYSSLIKLHIHKNGENFIYGFFGIFSVSTFLFTVLAVKLGTAELSDASDPSHAISFMLLPVIMITGTH